MTRKKMLLLYICLWIIGLCLVVSVIFPQKTPPAAVIPPKSNDIEVLKNGWKDGAAQAEAKTDIRDKTFSRKRTLPQIAKDTMLVIRNNYRGVQICIDNEVRLDYGYHRDDTKLLGNVYVRMPVTSEDSGKELLLKFKNNYSNVSSDIEYPMLVSASSFAFYILQENAGIIITVILLLLLDIILVFLIIWLKNRSFWLSKTSLYALMSFIFLTALWLLTDSPILQLYVSGSLRIVLLSFCSFMLMPIPLLVFINDALKLRCRSLTLLQLLLLGNTIVQCILYQAGILDFVQMLPFTHLLMMVSIAALLFALIREVRLYKTDYSRNILLAFFILALFSTVALTAFYLHPMDDYNIFFIVGLLLFIVMLSCFSFHKVYLLSQEQEQIQFYRQLAYTDTMTKARNRSAYEQRCQEMAKLKPDAPLTVFMFDINNLKHTNDTYGHHAGDTIIRSAADLLHTVFTDIGQIYRVGGDKFVVLSEKNYMSAQAVFSLLDQRLKEYNQTAELPLSIAKGFSSNTSRNKGIQKLLVMADQAMYEDKRKSRNL